MGKKIALPRFSQDKAMAVITRKKVGCEKILPSILNYVPHRSVPNPSFNNNSCNKTFFALYCRL